MYKIFFLTITIFIFSTCNNEQGVNTETKKIVATNISDIKRGEELVLKTKAILGKNLLGAITNKGTDAALSFCKVKAFPLVDSMATFFNVDIKRVSDKPRNSINQANKTELDYIVSLKSALEKGEKLNAIVKNTNTHKVGYYPILTNKMCLQCHGSKVKDIKKSTLNLLNNLYPNDLAQEYKANEVRGIWVLEFGE